MSDSAQSVLTLSDVVLEVAGKRLIDSVNVGFGASTRTVILGPNGAGKSLLMRICHGLIRPTTGTVRWMADDPPRQAMVFDRPVLLRRSVRGNLSYPLMKCGIARTERSARVAQALTLAGLDDCAGQNAHALSAGQQQRLALARAWALAPELLFLDEPTAHLDLAAARDIEAMLDHLRGELAAVVMTTHDLAQARRLADHVVFMHKGRVLEAAPAGDFFATPRTAEARHFLNGEMFE